MYKKRIVMSNAVLPRANQYWLYLALAKFFHLNVRRAYSTHLRYGYQAFKHY